MNRRLTFASQLCPHSSYGDVAFHTIRGIERETGAFISVRPTLKLERFGARIPSDIAGKIVNQIQPEEWEYLLNPPNNFSPTSGKSTIWNTTWESTVLPPGSVDQLNKAKCVIVPSSWNASCFSACGVKAPIRVVPHGVDPDVYKLSYLPPPEQQGKFVFGAAGRIAYGVRKGVDDVIDAFLREFKSERDVELRIKVHPDCKVIHTGDQRVVYTRAHLSERDLVNWYCGLNCFVSAARSEGFGLMQLQAMALGRPIISVVYGGVADFFRPELGYAIDYSIEPASSIYNGLGMWARPSMESLRLRMREAYEDRVGCMIKGIRAADSVKHLTWKSTGEQNARILSELDVFGEKQKPKPKPVRISVGNYYHSGDIGDIVYALPFIREQGGGSLLLGPELGPEAPEGVQVREPMSQEKFAWLKELLEAQDYIREVHYVSRYPGGHVFNLNAFRHVWFDEKFRSIELNRRHLGTRWPPETLAHYYFAFYEKKVPDDINTRPWIDPSGKIREAKIVINRTARYTSNPPRVDWGGVVEAHRDSIAFVGLASEHSEFCRKFGRVAYRPVASAIEMARLIAGADLFIGNESFPLSLAEGMKVRLINESWSQPHTVFPRKDALHTYDRQKPVVVERFIAESLKQESIHDHREEFAR